MAAQLAVIGAGPKAGAIAARVAAIYRWWKQAPARRAKPPFVHIFERTERVGAHWYGGHGYSDGIQEVCTPPDFDVVYPEASTLDLARYAWATFAAERALSGAYATHRELADYVAWVIDRARADAPGCVTLHLGHEVTSLRAAGARWSLAVGGATWPDEFDGVVVTAPGPARHRFRLHADVAPHVTDADAYWRAPMRDAVHAAVAGGGRVAIVGGGGAAAAICADLSAAIDETRDPGSVVLVAPQATLFTRGDSSLETRTLTDAELWGALSRDARRQVGEHLLSGVVFRKVMERIEQLALQPGFVSGRVTAAVPGDSARVGLWCLVGDGRTQIVEADWVVDASGFDPLWFAALLEPHARAVVEGLGVAALADRLDPALRLVVEAERWDAGDVTSVLGRRPGLHVPFLAGGARPPGRASLLQLGTVAREILAEYLHG